MDVNELVSLISNNGVSIAMLIYFCYYNKQQLDVLNKTLEQVRDAVVALEKRLERIEDK